MYSFTRQSPQYGGRNNGLQGGVGEELALSPGLRGAGSAITLPKIPQIPVGELVRAEGSRAFAIGLPRLGKPTPAEGHFFFSCLALANSAAMALLAAGALSR